MGGYFSKANENDNEGIAIDLHDVILALLSFVPPYVIDVAVCV